VVLVLVSQKIIFRTFFEKEPFRCVWNNGGAQSRTHERGLFQPLGEPFHPRRQRRLQFGVNATHPMKRYSAKCLVRSLVALGALGAAGDCLYAQSSDALLNKLVEKGILSTQEATELRKEADGGFNKTYRTKSGLPEWVDALKIYGDVRLRYEFFHTDNDAPGEAAPNKDRTRFIYRLRTGMTATLKDSFEVGFRIASGEPTGAFGGNPISSNQTFQDNGSKKSLWIDLAYGKWTPVNSGPWLLSGSFGKIENPFVADMAFDADYTPEGAGIQSSYAINGSHSLKLNGAAFVLDEINQGSQASDDPMLFGVQLRHEAKWTPELTSSIGLSWYTLKDEENLGNGAVPNVQVGNTRYGASVPGSATKLAGSLVYDYYPVVVDAALTYTLKSFPAYPGKFPIRIAGEYMENPGAETRNNGYWAGVFFGKAGKKGTWEASYRFKRVEADAWYEEFIDSDYSAYYQTIPGGSAAASGSAPGHRAGTGIQGHIFRIGYASSDSFQLGATYLLSELINPPLVGTPLRRAESGAHRFQVDATWKF
jgi:hypothetical protein